MKFWVVEKYVPIICIAISINTKIIFRLLKSGTTLQQCLKSNYSNAHATGRIKPNGGLENSKNRYAVATLYNSE